MPYSNLRRLAEERSAAIHDSIRQLRAEEEELCRELAGLESSPATATAPEPPAPVPTPLGVAEPKQSEEVLPYAFLTPKKAVLRFLQENPGPHTSKEIHDVLLAGGMVTTAKKTRDAVATVLSRQNGQTVSRVADGRWQALFPSVFGPA